MGDITINAPLSGVVLDIPVQVGQVVNAGDLLVLLESMKVHVRVEAEQAGTVIALVVKPEDNVDRNSPLLELSVQSNPSTKSTTVVNTVCDPDSFNEYGAFAVAAQRQRIDYETLKKSTPADAIITGVGRVNSVKTALVVNDYSVLAGTQGYFHHQKLDRILDIASRESLPVIMFTEGGGGRPGDTDVTTVNSGLQCASFGTWASLAGEVPRIAIANGYNFAGNAALFGAADVTIATKSSWVGMAGPAMIEGGGLGAFKPTDIGPSESQFTNGTIDILVDDETQACVMAKKVLMYFQNDNLAYNSQEQSALQFYMPENRRQTYDVRGIVTHIFDVDSFTELQQEYGRSIVTGFATLGGIPVGVMANDCQHLGGAIDVDAGEKAARFMNLCNQFSIPIISFCDTPGFMVGPEHETRGAVRRLAELFKIGAQITTPFFAVVLRKCYGLGAQAMLAGSTQRPNYTLAWPTGEFGPMGLEGAVKLGFSKELESESDADKREALYAKLLNEQYERGKAIEVASVLEIDAVIAPSQTREYLARCVRNR